MEQREIFSFKKNFNRRLVVPTREIIFAQLKILVKKTVNITKIFIFYPNVAIKVFFVV